MKKVTRYDKWGESVILPVDTYAVTINVPNKPDFVWTADFTDLASFAKAAKNVLTRVLKESELETDDLVIMGKNIYLNEENIGHWEILRSPND